MNKKKKIIIIIAIIILLIAVTAAVIFLVPESEEGDVTTTNANGIASETVSALNEISLSSRTLFLSSGDNASLSAPDTAQDVTYESSDPEVATVSSDGTVTAIKKGNALITAKTTDSIGYCGVLVDTESNLYDISNALYQTKIDRVSLTMPSIHQSFAYDNQTGDTYFFQKYDDTPADTVLNRVAANGTTEYMRLIDFGHAAAVALEHNDDGNLYIWVASDSDNSEQCTTVSRFLFEAGKVYQMNAGDVYEFADAAVTPLPYIDEDNGLLIIRTRSGGKTNFYYYDLASVVSGEDRIPLASFGFQAGAQTTEPGYYSFQGFAVSGKYVYVLEGEPNMTPQIVTWDAEIGNALALTQLSTSIYGNETWNGGYFEPEGLYLDQGKIYVGIASNPSGNRRSSIIMVIPQ